MQTKQQPNKQLRVYANCLVTAII